MVNNELNTIIEGCSICVVEGELQKSLLKRLQVLKGPSGFQKSSGMWLGPTLAPVWWKSSFSPVVLLGWGSRFWVKEPKAIVVPEELGESKANPVRERGQGRNCPGLASVTWASVQPWAFRLKQGKNAQLNLPCALFMDLSGWRWCLLHWNSREELRKKNKSC